jgi:phosphatidylserine/phosphatidylglycerophosphate/cardiolipin synthase-like enzyme
MGNFTASSSVITARLFSSFHMNNTNLSDLAIREATEHRQKLLETFKDVESLLIGAFNIGLDDLLSEIPAKYCYLVAAEVIAKNQETSSPDAKTRIFNTSQLQNRIASEQAMLRLLKSHHAKYWISGLSPDETPQGVLFSGDLMPSALTSNNPAGNSHELLLNLNKTESAELRDFGRWVMKYRPAKEILPTHNQQLTGSKERLPKFHHLLLTDPNCTLKKEVLQLLDQAEESIIATSWLLEQNCQIVQRLASAAQTKSVTIIAHDHKQNQSAFEFLAAAGAKILLCPGMHAKMLLIDKNSSSSAIITSANLLQEGYETGLELGLRLNRGDVRLPLLEKFVEARRPHCKPFEAIQKPHEQKHSVDNLKNLGQILKTAKPLKIF